MTVIAEASDNVGVTSVALYTGNTRLGTMTNRGDGTWSVSMSSTAYGNGTYSVHARASDAAGNIGTSTAINVRIAN